MGNQVLIAIRHDVNRSEIPPFSDQDVMGIYESDRVTKSFVPHKGIIVSHYHHSGDKVCLVTNNDLMVHIPVRLDMLHKTRTNVEFSALKETISEYRKYRYKSIRKSTKKNEFEESGGMKVSLFGYLTDETYNMPEKSFELMVQAMDTMPLLVNGVVEHRGWDDHIKGTPIVKIGTVDSNQMAFVELYGNLFSTVSEQRNKMEALSQTEDRNGNIIDFDTKFLKSLGYNVTV